MPYPRPWDWTKNTKKHTNKDKKRQKNTKTKRQKNKKTKKDKNPTWYIQQPYACVMRARETALRILVRIPRTGTKKEGCGC